MGAELRIFDEGIDIWRAMEARWRGIAEKAAVERGIFTAALSGGRTPFGFYCHLSRCEGLPWKHTELFQVDERFVPPGSGESNFRMIRSSLLAGVGVQPRGVHPVSTAEESAEAAARRYEELLRSFFGPGEPWPTFDLVLLGLGEDGHTASLFPGGPELEERSRWVVSSSSPAPPPTRVTLTLPVLNSARNVFFLATGAKKAPALHKVWEGGRDSVLPSSLVRPERGSLAYFVDREAGSLL